MLPKNREPTHPGELLAEILRDMEMTQKALASKLGITLARVNEIINRKRGVTAETAILLGRAFDQSPEMWMGMQADFDLWHAERRLRSAPKHA